MRHIVSPRALALAVVIPPLVILVLFFVVPLAYLLFISFMTNSSTNLFDLTPTLANYTELFTDSFYMLIIRRTLLSTAAVLALCFLLGYPVAFYLSRIPARRRLLMLMVLMVPLMISNVVRAYGWMAILSRQGLVSTSLVKAGVIERPMQFLYSFEAITLGLLTILLPFMIISLTNSLTTIDKSYVEASESLGAGPWRTFFKVTLPLSAPGIASGLMLVTFLTLSAYVAIALLGGPRYKLLVSLVFDSVTTFRWPRAAALSFALLFIALVIAALIQIVVRPQRVQGKG